MRTNGQPKASAAADPCLGKIEASWAEAKRKSDWCFCAEVLKFWVKHLSPEGQIPAEFNSEARKRIAFLEKKLDSMEFKEAKPTIDAIAYARKRINHAADAPARNGRFKAAISSAERARITRTLDTAFIAGLKRPLMAFSDPDGDNDESGSDGNDIG